MDCVFDSNERPYAELRGVAIGIAEVGDDQRHTGLFHREDENGPVLMLELQWHHRLRNDPAVERLLWVDPAAHSKRLAQVSDICRLVWRTNQKQGIPYGFSAPTDCFDADTEEYLVGPTHLGLTCASFVLAVFHRAGLPLVVYENWPTDRPEDREWQEKILRALERTGADQAHIDAVRNEVGPVRFRPEEVAAAATVSPLPADFETVRGRGQQVLQRLASL
jgi:hypothetical protein